MWNAPERVIDLKALKGDTSDNIPGSLGRDKKQLPNS